MHALTMFLLCISLLEIYTRNQITAAEDILLKFDFCSLFFYG